MELRHLRYFVAVAEELHFGRAANRLHIVQPALSQQIRKLEEELTVKLFFRSKRRVELTHAGRVFLVEARQILSRAEDAVQVAKRADRGEVGPLAVVCGPVAVYTVLPLVLPYYRARFPETRVRLTECPMADVVEALEDGTADVGLLLPYFHSEALKHETALTLPLLAVLPRSHPLARAGRISLKQLAKDPFILFPHGQGSGFYERVVAICQEAGFAPRVIGGVERFRTLLIMVGAGYGVSLVPQLPEGTAGGREVAYAGLREPYATIEMCMAWRATESSPLVAAFLDAVRAGCREFRRRAIGRVAREK